MDVGNVSIFSKLVHRSIVELVHESYASYKRIINAFETMTINRL